MATLTDRIYESAGFQLLAQGMKDREAFSIMTSLLFQDSSDNWTTFNRWAEEQLKEQSDA